MRIFGDPELQDSNGGVPVVKEEVMYGYGYKSGRNDLKGVYRGSNRGKSQKGRGRSSTSTSGRVLHCYNCDSTKHFIKDCPHKNDSEQVNMNVHITLMSSKPDDIQKKVLF